MGNFQSLAERVLIKNKTYIGKVSSFHPLAKETGNFQTNKGNQIGNQNKIHVVENQCGRGIHMETGEATNRKPLSIKEETFTLENTMKSFLCGIDSLTILNGFFDGVDQIGIQLLYEDKRWLKNICYGVQSFHMKLLLEKYINCWMAAMTQESIQYKKQNAGRFAANTFIREELKK